MEVDILLMNFLAHFVRVLLTVKCTFILTVLFLRVFAVTREI